MPEVTKSGFIIRTKLHRPRPSKDHLLRKDLLARLSQYKDRPLIFVTAPAGYGKSTLVSQWLDTCEERNTWLSLDENDNDIAIFLAYFISAIQQVEPLACGRTLSMVNVANVPPVFMLAASLINELELLEEKIILVLDDYHCIRDKNIHQLITTLLNYQPAPLILILVSRYDPPQPLAMLRSKDRIVEIRTRDLRFSISETKELLQLRLDVTIDTEAAAKFEGKTEGWVTGLCLAALTLRDSKHLQGELLNFHWENIHLMDYAVNEILSRQSSAVTDNIFRISILKRFCAPLCEALFARAEDGERILGREFLDIINRDNLFVIALDDEGQWYRYHHLFQAVLKRQLRKRFKTEEIAALNKLASIWFSENRFIEEAISYAVDAGDKEVLVSLLKEYRHQIVSREQWFPLNRWLEKIPPKYIQSSPELLLTKAWVYHRQARYSKLSKILDKIENLVLSTRGEGIAYHILRGEIQVLRGFQLYASGHGELSEANTRDALNHLPEKLHSERGFAYLLLALSLQMQGKRGQAYQVIYDAMRCEEMVHPVFKSSLLVALCYVSWGSADSKRLKPAALQLLKHGQGNDLPETVYIGHYFSGILHYLQNDLELAESILLPVAGATFAVGRAIPSIVNYCQCSFALASTYQAMGRFQEAEEIVDAVIAYMFESENVDLLEVCQAFQADLALRNGKIVEAELWVQNSTYKPFVAAYRFYTVALTVPRFFLAKSTAKSLCKAETLLTQLYDYHTTHHNTRVLIEILVLQVLLYDALGEQTKALEKLLQGLTLAEPGNWVRPFLDRGAEMENILKRLLKDYPTLKFARLIHVSFKGEKHRSVKRQSDKDKKRTSQSLELLPAPLSRREIEVLAEAANGKTNNELAAALHISPETVKRHLSTIYCKLQVKNRHQAFVKANSMGIL